MAGAAGGRRDEPFTGRATIGYDHSYHAEVFYLGLALNPAYLVGFVEACLERIGEDDSEGEDLLRGEVEEGDREMALETLKAGVEVRTERPTGL